MDTPELRVSARLADAAAEAGEHGKTVLSDMLTAESRSLADGTHGDVAARVASMKARPQKRPLAKDKGVMSTLRSAVAETHADRAERADACEECDTIINAAWLAEGFSSPEAYSSPYSAAERRHAE